MRFSLSAALAVLPAVLSATLQVAAAAEPEPPTEWIDQETGHRVIRLSKEPGTASLYFHQNSYSPDGKKLVVTTAHGISTIDLATRKLVHAAGNFYINDKPTGAVVGQQPFGGSRASGTNDKAGSVFNLIRWTSTRTIKETFVPPTDHRYPFMMETEGGGGSR